MIEKRQSQLWWGGGALLLALLGLLFALPWLPMPSSGKVVRLPFLPPQPPRALLFLGFPGCGDVCPVGMERLRQVQESGELDAAVQVGLVNIAWQLPPSAVEEYARSFHLDFVGYHLTEQELAPVAERLGVRLPSTAAEVAPSFEHPDAVFYLRHVQGADWAIAQVFSATRLTATQVRQAW
jgi:hypothetical protein